MTAVSLRFGVSHAHGGSSLEASVARFGSALQARLGEAIEPVFAVDYERLLDLVVEGRVDLAWLPPLVHARASSLGAELLAVSQRAGALVYRSALLVQRDSLYVSTSSLRGARLAWSDPSSASGHLFPRLLLVAAGLDPRRDFASEQFFGSSRRASAAVADGEADLCASYVTETAAGDPARARAELLTHLGEVVSRLRVLTVTDPIPPDGLVVAKGVDQERRARLEQALSELHSETEGAAALHALLGAERLSPVTDQVRTVVTRLRAHVPAGR